MQGLSSKAGGGQAINDSTRDGGDFSWPRLKIAKNCYRKQMYRWWQTVETNPVVTEAPPSSSSSSICSSSSSIAEVPSLLAGTKKRQARDESLES